ncbi:TPA: hypothetical protein ACOEAT_004761 [Enterobacter ludwigii]|uniref:Uncharacterized protein n=2 Tax=Pseudocitrobacter TaxID=1504576 RepID=A0ABM9FGY3_9ENTR|nr:MULTISPECIES: hypothetical protein [Enterobacteriaceae]MCY4777992.1 hypothetical protein [Klebsiella pneumoniae]MDG0038416.1 hypothetical protein [Klebsiella pneumoniae]MEA8775712.1 hypothetical protein [Klebsiella pneumoniae]RLL48655.1 hypothetical protein D9K90_27035 [Klebsiella pneumoniae]CAH6668430.1 hypothetical protein FBBNIHIM_25930 [Pseudocitrobacter vendiensis]
MPKRGKSLRSSSRNEETKPSKSTAKTTDRFISISFKHFHNVDDVGQSINTWKDDGSLPDLIEKLVYLTANGITKVISDGVFTNYTRFPESAVNDFRCPDEISSDEDWGVIKNIGGQKRRVAGFLRDNVFYIVFFDRDHRFWKSQK